MSFTELSRLTDNIVKNLKTGTSHLKEMVSLGSKATQSFSGMSGASGGTNSYIGGGTMGLGLSNFTAPRASAAQSMSATTAAPPGSGQQGFQLGLGLQGLPTSGEGSPLGAGMTGGLFNAGAGSGKAGAAMAVAGGLGAAAGVLLRAVGSGLPDVEETIGRRTNYYQAALRGNRSIEEVERATRLGLGSGITSRGSDALVAASLMNQGMVFSGDKDSTYMQTIRGVSNAARYLNMDNAAASSALEGLTSGAGSMNMLQQFGIHTSDPRTGKAYTQGQLFEQISQRITAGRPQATVDETLDSIRRGNLGETIRNIGLSTDQQEMLKQFMVSRASGQFMDLTDDNAMAALTGDNLAQNRNNPQLAGMTINALDTEQMEKATDAYIDGMNEAVKVIGDITKILETVPDAFKSLESTFSTLQGSQSGKFVEEFVNAMPGAISGLVTLGAFTALSGFAGDIGTALGAEQSSVPGSDSAGYASPPDLGSGTPDFQKPTNGPVTSWFGPRDRPAGTPGSSDHKGIDFGVGVGTPVVASAKGFVTLSTSNSGYGQYIQIAHSGNFITVYAHLSSRLVSAGQEVKAGQQIGLSGNTGISTGPHLHFEIRQNGTAKDPAPYLKLTRPANSSGSGGNTGGSLVVGHMDTSTPQTGGGAAGSLSSHSGSTGFGGFGGFGSSSPSSLSVDSFTGSGGAMGSLYLSGAPSAKTGDAYVANDGPVNVHAGEAILTSEQADDWRSMMRGSRKGGGNNVTINVQLSGASDGEARRLATMVKQYLEEDSLLNNMGRK